MKESILSHLAQLTYEQKLEVASYAILDRVSKDYPRKELVHNLSTYAHSQVGMNLTQAQQVIAHHSAVMSLVFPQSVSDNDDLSPDEITTLSAAFMMREIYVVPEYLRPLYSRARDIEQEYIDRESNMEINYSLLMFRAKKHTLSQIQTFKRP